MAPFTYESHANPYAASIGDLLLRRGDIAARAAEQVAAAQARAAESTGAANARAAETVGSANARATETSGQIWGDTARSIGQSFAGAVQHLTDPRRKLEAEQLSQVQRENRSRNIFEAELKNPANHNEDGTINDAAITARLQKQDVGAWQQWTTIAAANQKNALDLRIKVQELSKNSLDIQTKQQALGKAQSEYLGALAYNALGVLSEKPDDPLHARDTALAAIARAASDPFSPVSEAAAKGMLQHVAASGPTEIAQTFASFIPPELKAKLDKEAADTAKSKADAAKTAVETQNLKDFGRTTPGTPEEQYLHAITKGDKPTADRILQSIHDTANARKDPAAQAMARELAGLRGDEARARLEGLQKKNAPADIEPDVQTTIAGRRYIDLSGYTGEERNKARAAANASGVVGVSKEQANALQEIDNARANQRSIMAQIGDLLPQGAAGRGVSAVTVPLSKLFQTHDQIAAFGTWRTAAIQALRATAGSKGLRINQAEIAMSVENDIPKLTDTVGTARQKVQTIETMLENAEQSILVRDRSVAPAPSGPKTPAPLPPGLQRLQDRK